MSDDFYEFPEYPWPNESPSNYEQSRRNSVVKAPKIEGVDYQFSEEGQSGSIKTHRPSKLFCIFGGDTEPQLPLDTVLWQIEEENGPVQQVRSAWMWPARISSYTGRLQAHKDSNPERVWFPFVPVWDARPFEKIVAAQASEEGSAYGNELHSQAPRTIIRAFWNSESQRWESDYCPQEYFGIVLEGPSSSGDNRFSKVSVWVGELRRREEGPVSNASQCILHYYKNKAGDAVRALTDAAWPFWSDSEGDLDLKGMPVKLTRSALKESRHVLGTGNWSKVTWQAEPIETRVLATAQENQPHPSPTGQLSGAIRRSEAEFLPQWQIRFSENDVFEEISNVKGLIQGGFNVHDEEDYWLEWDGTDYIVKQIEEEPIIVSAVSAVADCDGDVWTCEIADPAVLQDPGEGPCGDLSIISKECNVKFIPSDDGVQPGDKFLAHPAGRKHDGRRLFYSAPTKTTVGALNLIQVEATSQFYDVLQPDQALFDFDNAIALLGSISGDNLEGETIEVLNPMNLSVLDTPTSATVLMVVEFIDPDYRAVILEIKHKTQDMVRFVKWNDGDNNKLQQDRWKQSVPSPEPQETEDIFTAEERTAMVYDGDSGLAVHKGFIIQVTDLDDIPVCSVIQSAFNGDPTVLDFIYGEAGGSCAREDVSDC